MLEMMNPRGTCEHCQKPNQAIFRLRTGTNEVRGCMDCLQRLTGPGQHKQDAPLPEGLERLSRAVEELAREVRVTRFLLATMMESIVVERDKEVSHGPAERTDADRSAGE